MTKVTCYTVINLHDDSHGKKIIFALLNSYMYNVVLSQVVTNISRCAVK